MHLPGVFHRAGAAPLAKRAEPRVRARPPARSGSDPVSPERVTCPAGVWTGLRRPQVKPARRDQGAGVTFQSVPSIFPAFRVLPSSGDYLADYLLCGGGGD